MDQGQLVEQGRHDELVEQGGLYSTLYETQFKENLTPEASAEGSQTTSGD